MCKISIVIPTLQKNTNILNKLLQELTEDNAIGEIILIDNSLKGFECQSEKVRVIIPQQNLYVNLSWNLGVKLAKYNYIGILNDDILIPKNLCQQILDKLKEQSNTGLIGMKSDALIFMDEAELDLYPEDCEISLEVQNDDLYVSHWGVAIFGMRNRFFKIPENIKVYCGDNYLIHENTKRNNICYQMLNCNIKHLGSLTSNEEFLNPIKVQDVYNYAKIDKRFKKHRWYRVKPSIWDNIFSVKNEATHKIITVLGIKIKFRRSRG